MMYDMSSLIHILSKKPICAMAITCGT